MSGYFFDSSALYKLYAPEAGSDRVRELVKEAPEVILSDLILPEMAAAMARSIRRKKMPASSWDPFKKMLAEDMARAVKIAVEQEILEAAVACIEKTELRGADAVHVASALSAGSNLFVSADKQQCESAKKLGLKVELVK